VFLEGSRHKGPLSVLRDTLQCRRPRRTRRCAPWSCGRWSSGGGTSRTGSSWAFDGANGLRKAVATVWGAKALVQRGQWHTREHGVRSLPTRQQVTWRRTLQAAYARPTSPDAQAALLRRRTELGLRNASAVGRLDEGVEETLTLHRLGRFQALGVSLKPTTCLESLMAQVGQVTDTVARWRTSDQQPRWAASALLAIEPRMRRIKGYRHLLLLRAALQREIASSTQQRESVA